MKIGIHIGQCVSQGKTLKNSTLGFPNLGRIMLKIGAIYYNWTITDRLETGCIFKNRPYRAEDTTS